MITGSGLSHNTAEILAIGNELLIGQTLDTNSNWLAGRLHAAGWTVRRITILRDSLKSISKGISEALNRNPDLLLTVGGLGPTYDDMTLNGMSIAIRKPLRLNPDAMAMLKQKYGRTGSPTSLTSQRKKMAILPRGAKPLPNRVGTAPGVLVRSGKSTLIAFPGVPSEMKAIFKESVAPFLKDSEGSTPAELYLMIVGIVESAFAPILEVASRKFPNLYLKSHPMGRETGVRSLIKLHVYTVGDGDASTLIDAVRFVLSRLAARISRSS